MNFRFVWKRTLGLIKSPDSTWELIRSEPMQYRKHFKHFAFPAIIALTFTMFIGLIGQLIYLPVYDSIIYVIIKTICIFLIYYFTLYVSQRLIFEMGKYFGINEDSNVIGILIIYSLAPFFLGSVLSHLLFNYYTLGNFIKFCGVYGIYTFYKGTFYLINMDNKKRLSFTLTVSISVIIIYFLLYWSLSFIWKWVPPISKYLIPSNG